MVNDEKISAYPLSATVEPTLRDTRGNAYQMTTAERGSAITVETDAGIAPLVRLRLNTAAGEMHTLLSPSDLGMLRDIIAAVHEKVAR